MQHGDGPVSKTISTPSAYLASCGLAETRNFTSVPSRLNVHETAHKQKGLIDELRPTSHVGELVVVH
jgi:hypothetical protein